MTKQLPFNLPVATSYEAADYIVTPANAEAHGQLLASLGPLVPSLSPVMILSGEKGAGKTHLAHVWLSLTGGHLLEEGATFDLFDPAQSYLIEDVDAAPFTPEREEWLFHLVNRIKADGGRLLITTRLVPSQWALSLADWRSRALSYPVLRLDLPDDETLTILLAKMAADRQLNLEPGLIEYMVRRMERSYAAVNAILSALDHQSLAAKKPITKRLAGDIMEEFFDQGNKPQ